MRKLIPLLLLLLASCRPIAAPVSPLSVPQNQSLFYLPLVSVNASVDACNQPIVAQQLAFLFVTDAEQKRKHPHCDSRLVAAAMYRAQDMATRNYFSHLDLDGHTPNYWARAYGCALPDWYPVDANNIESIGLNYTGAQQVWDGWKISPAHHDHVLGVGFWQAQTSYGFGYAESESGKYWVLMSAPGC